MTEWLFGPAFALWGAPTSWLEVLAFGLALAMVGCNIREIHWGWPLAAISSALYFGLFWRSKLYGDAGLQGLLSRSVTRQLEGAGVAMAARSG